MCLQAQDFSTVPESTAELARKVLPADHPYLILRDHLGEIYTDERFAALFTSSRGRPAVSPGCLALVLVLEFMENVSDSIAANQVRTRIDWKYLLGLELDDTGFDASVLSEFRQRLLTQGREQELLTVLLEHVAALGLLKKRGRQRTDSTHVLAAVAQLNRLELVGEALHAALESLAVAAPQWLQARVPPAWYSQYGHRFVHHRQPQAKGEREALAQQIAADGAQLLTWCWGQDAPAWLRKLPAVDTLRQIWLQQYCFENGQWRWRSEDEKPPHTERIVSPYDLEARYSRKRMTEWSGYKAHVTETCDPHQPRLITNVETDQAAAPDHQTTAVIHAHLAEQGLLPREHLVDNGYLDAGELVAAHVDHQVALIGPVREDRSWQALAAEGYAAACFVIDWETQQVTCPQGQVSNHWYESQDAYGEATIHVEFKRATCAGCPVQEQCTRGARRTLSFRPQAQYEALQQRRREQHTPEFQAQYNARAGVEGTISQTVRQCGLRRARYRGRAKTHLQNLATAVAINLSRLAAWWSEIPARRTQTSHFAALAPI